MLHAPTLTILGTGYVGLTTAALYAAAGIRTYVVDPNDERLAAVRAGRSFFYEAGLDPLIAQAVQRGLLIPTSSYKGSVAESDIIMSAVGTPDNPDGSSNLQYVFAAATEAAQYMKPGTIYVQRSTVPVGTGARLQQVFTATNIPVQYVSNPEFLREGTALQDSLWFDRFVVGGSDGAALDAVIRLHRRVERARGAIAVTTGLVPPRSRPAGRYVSVGLESAELIKVVSNAFLALKISFANSIARLADAVGANVVEVMDVVGADQRIGKAFLQAGRGYGGGCFPKDVSGLIAAGQAQGVDLAIMQAAQAVNKAMPEYIIERLQAVYGASLRGCKIAVLGLAFKAGTSDARRSPGVELATRLAAAGAQVMAYDPQAKAEAAPLLPTAVTVADTIEQALHNAEAVIIATDWPEFITYPAKRYAQHLAGTIVVDAMNCLDPVAVTAAGLLYVGVGRRA